MKYINVALIAIVLLFAVGCSSMQDPISHSNASGLAGEKSIRDLDARGPITYEIELLSAEYDVDNDVTLFTYSVISNPDDGPAISHWVIGFEEGCGSSSIIVSSNDPLVGWNESDPTTGVRGVKFDTGYDDQEEREVTLTLAGFWTVDVVEIAVKAGNDFIPGTVQGPVCGSTPEPTVTYEVNGIVYFDINGNGTRDADEPAIGGIAVTLSNDESGVSDANGAYLFDELLPGSYTVSVDAIEGFDATTPTSVELIITAADVTVDFGFELNFGAINGGTADGLSIGYWKTNIQKAISGKPKGIQISTVALEAYTAELSTFALSPLNFGSLQGAYNALSDNSSNPVNLLTKQLTGSEYNFANGAYINGNELLTWGFVFWGEYIIAHASDYTSGQILNAKDWFDAYNNSHGGAFFGPAGF